jgi:hypothetical protein
LRLIVDPERVEASSRLVAVRLALLTLRAMENWRRNLPDYESAMIVVALVGISAERLTRAELETELQSLAAPLPPTRLAPCNLASIAAATGLNRETTRRKVKALIERGILARDERGALNFAPGRLQDAAIAALIRRQLDAVVRTVDDLMRSGVVSAVD